MIGSVVGIHTYRSIQHMLCDLLTLLGRPSDEVKLDILSCTWKTKILLLLPLGGHNHVDYSAKFCERSVTVEMKRATQCGFHLQARI